MSTKTEEKIMEEYGLDIKDLAKIAKALQGISADKPEKVTKSVTTSIAKWELALCNYPDFAIKRTTAKTEQLLVIMPSCGGYYIKYNKNGQEISEPLTEESDVSPTNPLQREFGINLTLLPNVKVVIFMSPQKTLATPA